MLRVAATMALLTICLGTMNVAAATPDSVGEIVEEIDGMKDRVLTKVRAEAYVGDVRGRVTTFNDDEVYQTLLGEPTSEGEWYFFGPNENQACVTQRYTEYQFMGVYVYDVTDSGTMWYGCYRNYVPS